ncbi:MAG: Oxidoreductase, 2Fe-2S and FAD/NAD(P) binding domain protein [Microgenomates group bacterium GW2011_GWC1_39_7b]|uniref:Oxidoreductase, 2Fe-2S and FAD/NAD(P) binding domain protein n=2 Tax=Candidatus Woeseibacteriota TaxID=1752722 RepID=A0A0G0LL01_9BACT|nr:MAG: Oxidoreductase, 2Fe-2S and FAD/NAD(P) binding domain protein [Candidatus Woesebacteria bacterium GW2011_GWB1_39_10]KKR26903.1 MAG: Oxidoreductase, 2Fe-2S and FAD/NAD(P) binding domain protein [Microgenomates group bacterium GW2011_GWC1_39_7b]KKS90704.1 MAG: Oxidoreductase, 2Fe-2S and FAD/NAD(P) binding domain protein [Candidatus Woesebacteria bacterium GW2011_GWA1_43_12]
MKLKLVEKREEAKGTVSFFWEPEKPVDFLAGQYYYFSIPKLKYPDSKGTTRHFTISSSPTEGNLLWITTRIREKSGYKKTLNELPIDTEIEGEGPNGTFILDEKDIGPQVFIAGGVGITPFRSIIKYAIDKNIQTPMYLIYSNSDSQFVFKDEFDKWASQNDYFKVSYFDSSVSGHLDSTKLQPLLTTYNILHTTFWLAGPPPMVDAMEQVLGKLKITSDKIRSEKFTGY